MLVSETELVSVKIPKRITQKLRNLAMNSSFNSSDEYASFLMNSIMDEIEASLVTSTADSDREIESHQSGYVYTEKDIEQIKEELRPLVWISC
jgi:hypothetical protein